MKKILLHCGELSTEDWLNEHERVTVLTPSRESAIQRKVAYIRQRGGMVNRAYLTFDNWIKSFSSEKIMDPIFQSFVLEKVLKKCQFHAYDTMLQPLISFFHDLDRNCIGGKELRHCGDAYFESLAGVYEQFQQTLQQMGCTSGLQIQKVKRMQIPKGQYVLEGFLTFSPLQMEILKVFSEDSIVIINFPYHFKNCPLLSREVEKLIGAGFEVVEGKNQSLEEFLKDRTLLSYEVPQHLKDIFYGEYKGLLQENASENLTVYYSSKDDREDILRRGVYEGIEWNCDKKNDSKILREWMQLFLYFKEKSKEHLLYRIQLHYFPILPEHHGLETFLRQQDFQRAEEFYNCHRELPLEEKDHHAFVQFFQLVQQEEIADEEKIEYYLEYFSHYLEEAEKIATQDYELLQEEDLYRKDLAALDFLRLVFDSIRQYQSFASRISKDEFLRLMILYLEKRSLSDIKNRRSSLLVSLEEGYDLESKVKIFFNFNGEYSSDEKNSFLYSKGHEQALQRLGLWEDHLELDFLRLLVALYRCQKAIFLTDTKESGFSPIYYMLKKYIFLQEGILQQRPVTSPYNMCCKSELYQFEETLSDHNLQNIIHKLKDHVFSPTDFDAYIVCPRYYLYQRVFHVEEIKKGLKEEHQKKEGIAYHKVLEHFYRRFRPQWEEDDLKQLILRFFFENRQLEELDFYEEISFQNFFYILKSYLQKEREIFMENGFFPFATEEKFFFSLGDCQVQGIIDRIDVKEGKEIITDYKRRSGATVQDVLEGRSLQLPIYALNRQAQGKEVVAMQYGELLNGKVKSILVNAEELPCGAKNAKVSKEEFEQFLERSKERIISCHEKIMKGEFPKAPLKEDQCLRCVYQGVCWR